MALLEPLASETKPAFSVAMKYWGAIYHFRLFLDAALPSTNAYTLELQTSVDPDGPPPHDLAADRKSTDSWFTLWTRDWKPAAPPRPNEGSLERRAKLAREWIAAESHLINTDAIQLQIITAMRRGATFSTSHKEGGTTMCFHNGRFLAADYGESTAARTFATDVEFLSYLRQFYDYETSRNVWPARIPDEQAWKLILRLMRPGPLAHAAGVGSEGFSLTRWLLGR